MKFQLLTTALYASLAIASAIPATAPADALVARADIENVENDWECPNADESKKPITYKKAEIKKAIEQGMKLRKEGKTVGPNKGFPYPIADPQSIPGMPIIYWPSKDVQHFPLKNGKSAYSGPAKPKDERVMYHQEGADGDARFIGVWTHARAAAGQYTECKEKDD